MRGGGLMAMEFHAGAMDVFWDHMDMVAGGH